MHKFNVKYTFDNYVEYYKHALLKNRYIKDVFVLIVFIGIGIYWLVDKSKNTEGNALAIVAFVFAGLFIALDFATLPMLKKQIRSKQADIDRTHVYITFNHDDILYTNLTQQNVEETVHEPTSVEEEVNQPVEEKTAEGESIEETPVVEESVENKTEDVVTEDVETENANEFTLKYDNIMLVRETTGLFLFYLDKKTVIIIPKETYEGDFDIPSFKEFIKCKINEKRIKFLKDKN